MDKKIIKIELVLIALLLVVLSVVVPHFWRSYKDEFIVNVGSLSPDKTFLV